jgi:hypothetical protein
LLRGGDGQGELVQKEWSRRRRRRRNGSLVLLDFLIFCVTEEKHSWCGKKTY